MNAPPTMLTLADLARREDLDLGGVRISPSTRVLRGPLGEASIEPRAMQVLLALCDASGRVVTRDELFRRCWGAAAVGDDSLNRAVADLRSAVRTVAAEALAIETVPRTGYRILVRPTADAAGSPEGTPRSARRTLLLGAAAAACAAAGGAVWLNRRDPDEARAAELVGEAELARQAGAGEAEARALRLLESATRLAPGNAEAWGKLALVAALMADGVGPDDLAAHIDKAQVAARHALAIAPRQSDARAALAILPPYFGDWAAAERRFDRVLELAPDHVATRDARAFLYVSVGRVRENYAERLAIMPREPVNATLLYRMVYAHWIMGRVGDADRAADRALQLRPRHPAAWFARLWVSAFTGRAERALAQLADGAGRPDLPPWMIETLRAALTAIASGRPADISIARRRLLEEVTLSPSASVNALLLLNGMGEIDAAFDVAQAYHLERGPLMASVRWRPGQVAIADQRRRKTHMLFVPVAAPMRGDPRFRDLVERIGLSAYWRSTGRPPDGPGFPLLA